MRLLNWNLLLEEKSQNASIQDCSMISSQIWISDCLLKKLKDSAISSERKWLLSQCSKYNHVVKIRKVTWEIISLNFGQVFNHLCSQNLESRMVSSPEFYTGLCLDECALTKCRQSL